MWRLIKIIIAILLFPLLAAFAVRGLPYIASLANWATIQWATLGFAGYALISGVLPIRLFQFLEVFCHEVVHLITATIFRIPVRSFQIDLDQGTGTVGLKTDRNFMVNLAPYWLPLPLLLVLAARIIFRSLNTIVLGALLGASLAFHYRATYRAMRVEPEQTDFTKTGSLFSAVVIVGMNLIILVFVLFVLADDLAGILDYFRDVLALAPEFYRSAWEKTLDLSALFRFWLAI